MFLYYLLQAGADGEDDDALHESLRINPNQKASDDIKDWTRHKGRWKTADDVVDELVDSYKNDFVQVGHIHVEWDRDSNSPNFILTPVCPRCHKEHAAGECPTQVIDLEFKEE